MSCEIKFNKLKNGFEKMKNIFGDSSPQKELLQVLEKYIENGKVKSIEGNPHNPKSVVVVLKDKTSRQEKLVIRKDLENGGYKVLGGYRKDIMGYRRGLKARNYKKFPAHKAIKGLGTGHFGKIFASKSYGNPFNRVLIVSAPDPPLNPPDFPPLEED